MTADYASEGVLFAETARGSIVYRHYRGPGRRSSYAKELVRWTTVVTHYRLLVRRGNAPMINVPWTEPRIGALDVAVHGGSVAIRFDTSVFRDDASGIIEVRVHTADPAALVRLIETMRRHARR